MSLLAVAPTVQALTGHEDVPGDMMWIGLGAEPILLFVSPWLNRLAQR